MKHPVYIDSATFCIMRFINYPLYLHGDKDCCERLIGGEVRKENAVFVEADVGEPSANLRKYDLLEIRTTGNISSGDEICRNYGKHYTVSSELYKWELLRV